ncbi:MAG: CmpA/NrtA family ABC transporter substrate-binding protein, partial [Methylococcaceae bacterium]|nr:CmpA/NrtA family ABC transporter substrate-binding protein [Methylococcaceae bacterium]
MNLTSLVTIKKLATALCTIAAVSSLTLSANVYAAEKLEKESLKLGFIKLTDMAPLAVALEKGYFEDEGLSVQLEAQANWKVLLDRVISGELDGAHMLATLPFGTAIGYGTKADIVSAFTLTLNGDAITVSNDVWKQMKPQIPVKDGKPVHPIKADTLKPVLEKYKAAGKPFNMAMTFPVGTHNMKLRYWLAAGGIKPGFYAPPEDTSGQIDAEAMLSVTPPP